VLVRAARLVAGFAASIVTARALGPAGRGDYFFVVALSAIVVQFAHLGLASSNTYLVARRPRLLGPLVVNSAWVALVLGGGMALIAVQALSLGGWFGVPPHLLMFAIGLAPVSLFYLLGINLLIGAGRIVAFNVIETSANVLVLIAIVAAAVTLPTTAAVLGASVVGWSVASLLLLRLLTRSSPVHPRFDHDAFGAGVQYAARAYVVTLLGLLVLRASVFIVQRVAGSTALGEFSIATQLAEVIGILPASTALVLFPRLVRDPSESWLLAVRTCGITGLILTGACGIVAFVADPLVRLAYGPTFTGSVAQLQLLLPGVVCLGMLSVLSQFVAAVGMPLSIVWAWLMGLLSVVLLCAWLVPIAGGAGAVIALSVTYLALLIMAFAVGFAHRDTSALQMHELAR